MTNAENARKFLFVKMPRYVETSGLIDAVVAYGIECAIDLPGEFLILASENPAWMVMLLACRCEAARLLSAYAGGASEGFGVDQILGDGVITEKAYRLAALKTHPDRTGTRGDFERVTVARDHVQRHFTSKAGQRGQ